MGLSVLNKKEIPGIMCHPPEPPSAETPDASLVLGQHRPEVAALPLVSDGSDHELLRGRRTRRESRF